MAADGGGSMGSGNLSLYVDATGARHLVFSFADGSFFILGVE